MATLAELIVKIGAETSALQKGLQEARGRIETFGKSMEDIGKKSKDVGTTMSMLITAPLAAAGTAAFAAASDINKAMHTIRAGTGATGEQLKALGNDFKKVFAGVPQSAGDVSTAIADLNTRLGLSGPPLQEMATQMLNLARVSKTEVSTVVASTTRMFGDWSIATEKQSGALDYLWKVSQTTGIGVDTLAQRVVQFGAPLRQMGFDFETAAAMLGKWEKEGVNSELVLGSLRIGLIKFAKAGEDAPKALSRAIEEIKNMGSAAEANARAVEIFGARAGPDMAAAIREGRFDLDALLKNLKESPETINKAAQDTLGFSDKLKILKNNAESALAPLGDVLLNLFNSALPVLQSAAVSLQKLSDWFAKLSPEAQRFIVIAGGMAAGLGPALYVAGTLAGTIGNLIGIVSKLPAAFAILTPPAGIIIAAIGALAFGAYKIYKHWDGIKAFFVNLWESIKATVTNAANAVLNFLRAWGPLILAAVTGPVGLLVYAVATHWEQIKQFTSAAWDTIKAAVVGAFQWMYDHNYYFQALVDFIKAAWDAIKEFSITTWNGIKDTLTGIWDAIKGVVTDRWQSIQDATMTIWSAVSNWLFGLWARIQGQVLAAWNTIYGTISGVWNRIKEGFDNLVKAAWNWGLNLIHNFIEGFKSKLADLWDAVKEAADAVAGFLGFHSPTKLGPGREADKWAPNLVKMYAEGITASLPKLRASLNEFALNLSPVGIVNVAAATAAPGGGNVNYGGITINIYGGSTSDQADQLLRELARRGVRF